MLKHIYLLLFIILWHESNSQSSDKIFHSIGTSIDFGSSPINMTSSNDLHQLVYIAGLLAIDYEFRYNIADLSDEVVLSASISPGISIADIAGSETTDSTYFANQGIMPLPYRSRAAFLKIPLIISIEKGAGASFMSQAEIGGFFGVGLEYNYLIDINSDYLKRKDRYQNYIFNWIQPCMKLGLRYFNNDKINSISLKLGYGSNKPQPNSSLYANQINTKPRLSILSWFLSGDSFSPFTNNEFFNNRTLTLTYSRIINY